jgi:glycosyltransferase involved in cell wall biosynthesis
MSDISVVIPLYNRASFIEETLDSVASQSLQPLEVVVVDDLSTDDSVAVVKRYAARSPLNIRLLTNTRRKGVSGATNTGTLAARGEYVALLDSDDLWTPGHLRQLREALDSNPGVAVAFSAVEFFGPVVSDVEFNNRHFKESVAAGLASAFKQAPNGVWLSGENLLASVLSVGFVFRCPASLIRRVFLTNTGLLFDEELAYTQDSHFMTCAAAHTGFAYVDAIGLRIRRHAENVSPTHYGENVIKGYELRVVKLKQYFGSMALSPEQRRALKQRLWTLQSAVMFERSRGQNIWKRLILGWHLLTRVPSIPSAKSAVKNLLTRS